MIATCPACHKRYRMADDAVPAAGRSLRCAACGHSWTALPEGTAAGDATAASALATAVPADSPLAGRTGVDDAALAARAATPALAATAATAAIEPEAGTPADARPFRGSSPSQAKNERPAARHRRWGWVAALVALLAIGALAVIEFAPEDTFNPPRLGLPAPHLAMADLGSIAVPTLPPLDLAQVPVVGSTLDRWFNPPPLPAVPLRITAHGERRTLANGTRLLTVSGTIANPTSSPVALAGIDAALLDPAGHRRFRWRIAAPASVIAAHGSAAFEAVAANYPAGATLLQLTPR